MDGGRVGLADSLVHTPALHDLYQPPRRRLQGFIVVSADQRPHLRRYVPLGHAPGTGIGVVMVPSFPICVTTTISLLPLIADQHSV